MKQYVNERITPSQILSGFKPICANLFDQFELSNIHEFVEKYTPTATILVNPDVTINDEDEFEYDYEIYGGNIEIKCNSEKEGHQLSLVFGALTQMRCDCNKFKNGIAYCDFESE